MLFGRLSLGALLIWTTVIIKRLKFKVDKKHLGFLLLYRIDPRNMDSGSGHYTQRERCCAGIGGGLLILGTIIFLNLEKRLQQLKPETGMIEKAESN